MDPRLQNWRAHYLLLRLFRPTHRSKPPRQRRLPPRPQNQVERPNPESRHRRGRPAHPPRVPEGLELSLAKQHWLLNRMIAFEVKVNGRRVCIAGADDLAVLNTIISASGKL